MSDGLGGAAWERGEGEYGDAPWRPQGGAAAPPVRLPLPAAVAAGVGGEAVAVSEGWGGRPVGFLLATRAGHATGSSWSIKEEWGQLVRCEVTGGLWGGGLEGSPCPPRLHSPGEHPAQVGWRRQRPSRRVLPFCTRRWGASSHTATVHMGVRAGGGGGGGIRRSPMVSGAVGGGGRLGIEAGNKAIRDLQCPTLVALASRATAVATAPLFRSCSLPANVPISSPICSCLFHS